MTARATIKTALLVSDRRAPKPYHPYRPHSENDTAEGTPLACIPHSHECRHPFCTYMSTQSAKQQTVECDHPDCTEHGRRWEFHHGRYCSNECEHRHEGRKALARWKFDHQRCFSCMRQLKTILDPKDDLFFDVIGYGWTRDPDSGEFVQEMFSQEVSRQSAVGEQFRTEHAGVGEQSDDDDSSRTYRTPRTGTICEHCGQTDHREHDPLVAPDDALDRLLELIGEDEDLVVDEAELRSEYADHEDLELAVGKAKQDASD